MLFFRCFRLLIQTVIVCGIAWQGLVSNANAWPGDARTAFVYLYEWPWKDVAQECKQFLGPNGYGAVLVSPPNEHAVLPGYPWYERYQTVSYQLNSRSGNRDEFQEMVRVCNASGVKVYVDAVINHTTWVNRSNQMMYGSGGSMYGEYNYPGIYQYNDFHHCGRNGNDSIRDYSDRWEVQNCNLSNLADLRTESESIRDRLAAYLDDLLNLGVSGFRIDAAKHIPATDLQAILGRLHRPFYNFQEVIDYGNEPIKGYEYYDSGDVMEFRYAQHLSDVFKRRNLGLLEHFGQMWGFMPDEKAVVFVDNHDLQRSQFGGDALTYKDGQPYFMANVFMLAWPYGYPELMSSFRFSDTNAGPPSDSAGKTRNIFSNNGAGCGGDWVCEHRNPAIVQMVKFRNWVQNDPVVNWWSGGNDVPNCNDHSNCKDMIAFGRGSRGFVILSKNSGVVNREFSTNLPAGTYCDLMSGGLNQNRMSCAGRAVQVNERGGFVAEIGPNSALVIATSDRLGRSWRRNR